MKVTFFHDGPLLQDDLGSIYGGVLSDEIIDRYFYFCDSFEAVTRLYPTERKDEKYMIKHPSCRFVGLPNHNAIPGYFKNRKTAKVAIKKEVENSELCVCRVPSWVGEQAVAYALKMGKPYLTEVVGCAWDSLRSHSFVGKLLAPLSRKSLRKAVSRAPYAMYVTNEFLQNRYPTTGTAIGCSDVVLQPAENAVLEKRLEKIKNPGEKLVLGTCGVLNVKYKGQEHIIRQMPWLLKEFPNLEYQLVGGGDYSRLQDIACENGVADHVKFIGSLPHEKIFEWLDQLDLYAQPSDTEGLCRALIEALSRGLPCIASDVGGNPELVSSEVIFHRKDGEGFRKVFETLAGSREKMAAQANINFNKAKEYEEKVLLEKRHHFYDGIKEDILNKLQ